MLRTGGAGGVGEKAPVVPLPLGLRVLNCHLLDFLDRTRTLPLSPWGFLSPCQGLPLTATTLLTLKQTHISRVLLFSSVCFLIHA